MNNSCSGVHASIGLALGDVTVLNMSNNSNANNRAIFADLDAALLISIAHLKFAGWHVHVIKLLRILDKTARRG